VTTNELSEAIGPLVRHINFSYGGLGACMFCANPVSMSRLWSCIALLTLGLCSGMLGTILPGEVLVIEDFEAAFTAQGWTGKITASEAQASHGKRSGVVRLEQERAEVSLTGFPGDWRKFDRLLFDVYNDRDAIQTLSLRIYDEQGFKDGAAKPDDYFEARNKLIIQKGWNHMEINLRSLQAASYARNLALDRICKISLFADRIRLPVTIYIDNFRLVRGEETAASASRLQPQDTVTVVDNRFFTVRQVARPEDVPESDKVKQLRKTAEQERELLKKIIRAAQLQGIDTIYQERHLVTADLGLNVRPKLPWFNNDVKKTELFSYVANSCRVSRQELENLLTGITRLPHTDDTQVGDPLVPPYPPLKGRAQKGWFFLDQRGGPMFVISLHSPSQTLLRFFATPRQHIESYSVGGGSRWSIDTSPVYEAFKKYPDTHRVGWDGWCGHLIRDLYSMGGSKMENTVICLESPHIREAVKEYIRINIPKFHANPDLLYDIMAYELMYICYCDRSQQGFREYIKRKHGTIQQANSLYGTSYKGFDEITAPPVKNSRPLTGTNRALWYDWARYNMDRFTDYLLWVKSCIRELDPQVPLAAGGSSSMLAGRTGTTGIDEERIVNEIDDVIIHEGAGSTLGMDLQLALSETKKPLADPEMSLRSVYDLFPHALHGKSVMQIFHWPAQPQSEFFSMNGSALPHSWQFSLADVSELLRAALDIRRLSRELAAFVDAPAEVAILYSQTSTLQLPPEMLTWSITPYLAELEKTYRASQYLDAKVTFVTERQIEKGWLNRYKLLLIPAVRNIPASVMAKIWAYVVSGGKVLIMPESFLGDEYNHPREFLGRLGISIEKTEKPQPGGTGRLVQGYDQSFSEEVILKDNVRLKITPATKGGIVKAGELETDGIRQTLRISAPTKVLYRYPNGGAALVRSSLGKGQVYYSAASLDERSYNKLLDGIFEEAGVFRPVRAQRLDGEDEWRIECRFVQVDQRKLLYVINFNAQAARIRLDSPAGFFSSLADLRLRSQLTGNVITVEPRQTAIYELR